MKFSFLLVFMCAVFLFSGCSETKPIIEPAELVGEWTLVKAERDSKETTTLLGLTFEFKQDKFIRLNLPHPNLNSDTDYKYDIRDNKLRILNADLSFDLIEFAEDQLVVKTILEENEFTFWLSK